MSKSVWDVILKFGLLALFLVSAGCGKMSLQTLPRLPIIGDVVSPTNKVSLSGVVEPLTSTSSAAAKAQAKSQNKSQGKSSEISAFSCSSPSAALYLLDTNGAKVTPARGTVAVDASGSYTFDDLASLGVQISGDQISSQLLVEVSGCSETLSRIVTGTKEQNVNYGSSLLSWVMQSDRASAIASASKQSLAQIMTLLKTETSLTAAYSTLLANATLSTLFTDAFGVAPTILLNVAPTLSSATVPTTANELAPISLIAQAQHWSASYDIAYEWKLGSTTLATTGNASWTPSANSQGSRTITLYAGSDDGSGRLDFTKPHTSKTFSVQVANTAPASVSGLTILGPSHVNGVSLTLRLTTGALVDGVPANCASFSSLAIVESDDTSPITTPPTSNAAYSINCTTAGTQYLSYVLTTGEGTKTLRLWARDSAGNISSAPATLSVRYSTAGPNVTINSPLSNARVTNTFTLTGACDATASDVTITGDVVGSPITTTCNSGTGTYSASVTVSTGDGTKGVAVEQQDAFTNTGSATRTYVLDTVRPTVTLASAISSLTNSSTIPVTVTFSESVSGFTESDLVLTNATVQSSSFTGSGTSYSFTLIPSGQGTVSVSVPNGAASDEAGNTSQASTTLSRTYDSTSPSVTLARAGGQAASTNALPITFDVTVSETLQTGSLTLSDFNITGSASGITWTLTSSDDRNFVLRATAVTTPGSITVGLDAGRAQDLAGNHNSAAASSVSVAYDPTAPAFTGLATSPQSPGNNKRPGVTGTTKPSSNVSLHMGSDCSASALATATADATTGAFTLTPSADIGADATYSLRVKALDTFGNSACSTALSYKLDTAKPTVTVARASGQSALTNTLPIQFTITFSEAINPATIDLSKITRSGSASGITWNLSTSNNTVYTLTTSAISSPGTLSISIDADQVSDLSGNLNAASSGSASAEFDNLAPTFSGLVVSPTSPGSNAKPTLSGTTKASSAITLHLNAACSDTVLATSTAAGDGSFSLTPSSNIGADGSYSLYAKAVDPAGNSACSGATTYVLDSTVKSITISSAGLGSSPSNSTIDRTVTLSSADATHYKALVITSGLCTSADFSSATETPIATAFTFTPTANASNTVCAIGKSSAGVWEPSANAASSTTLVIDTVAPTFTGLAISPSTVGSSRKPTLSGTTEGSAALTLHTASDCSNSSLGSATAAAGGTFSLQPSSNLSSDADYNFYLKATDAAGNTTCSSSPLAYKLDTTAPVLAFTAPAASSYVNSSNTSALTVSGTCSENLSSVSLTASDGTHSVTATPSCASGTFSTSMNLTSLDEGNATISLSGSDAAGNAATSVNVSVTKDTAAPTATLSGTPTTPSNASSLNVTIAGSSVTHYKYKVGSTGGTTCSDSSGYSAEAAVATAITASLGAVADGSVTLCVIGRDVAGNYQSLTSATSASWNKDTTAPTLAITAPTNGGYTNSSNVSALSVSGTCSEVGRTISIAASGGATVSASPTCAGDNTFTTTLNLSSLNEGSVTLTADHSDASGNAAPQVSLALSKDTLAPSFTLGSLPASIDKATALAVSVSGADVTHYRYKVGASGSVTCSSATGYSSDIAQATSITDSLGSDGSYKLCVIAKDAAANYTAYASATSHTWTKDTVVTAFGSVTSSPASPGKNPTPVMTGTSEPSAVVKLYSLPSCLGTELGSTTAHATTGTFSITSANLGSDGVKNLSLEATDLAGNVLCLNPSYAYELDTTAPVLTVTQADGASVKGTFTISGTCETGRTVNFSGTGLQSGSAVTCASSAYSQSITLTSGESTKAIIVTSTDPAGNTSTVNRSFVRDDTAPVLAFSSPAANTYHATGLTITGTCETGLDVSLSGTGVDASSTATCSSGSFSKAITFSASDGVKAVTISQTDAAGNVGTASRNFERYTPPAVNFSAAAQNVAENQGTVTVTLTLPQAATKTVTVPITTSGTATLTTDYSLSTSSVVFSVGDSSKTLTVNLVDDTTSDSGETIVLGFGSITDGAAGTITTQTLTVYEPSLDLNFASLANDGTSFSSKGAPYSDITFTRNSIATYFGADGRLKTVKANIPRFDHDPVTGQPKGLLIEEARTNLLIYSDQFDNAIWNKGATTVSANAMAGPDGSATADKLVESTSTGFHSFDTTQTKSASTLSYSYSIYAKAAERTILQLNAYSTANNGTYARFNLASGTIYQTATGIGTSPFTSLSAQITAVGNGFYRCSISFTTDIDTSIQVAAYLHNGTSSSYTGDGTSGLYLWGAQLEQGTFPTSYIPTTTAAVTRNTDVATISDITSFFNHAEGTFIGELNLFALGPNIVNMSQQFFELANSDGSERFALQRSRSTGKVTFWSSLFAITGTTNVSLGLQRWASAYKSDGLALDTSFDAATTSASVSMLPDGTLSSFWIGSDRNGSESINGTISRLQIFKKRISNETLETLDTLSKNFRSITPTAQFTLASQAVLESTSKAYFTVMLNEPSTSSVTVPYTINGSSTAVSATDYSGLANGSVTFSPGETRKSVGFTLINRAGGQSARNLILDLGSPTGATLGSRTQHTLKIVDTNTGFTIASATQSSTGNTVTYTGTCDPALGDIIVTGQQSTTITCQNDGTWSFTSASIGTDGAYTFYFAQTDSIGSISYTGTWTRDTQVTAFASLAFSPASPGVDPTPTLSGTTEANATIELFKGDACSDSSKIIGKTTASGAGAFSVTPGYRLGTSGSYNLYVKATDALGNTLCSSAQAYVLKAPALDLAFTPIRNLLSYSEQVGNTGWVVEGASIAANAIAGPDGATTADKITESTNTGTHRTYNSSTSTTAQTYTASIYAKAAENTGIWLRMWDGTTELGAMFDLSNGTIASVDHASVTATIVPAGNGFYRCIISRSMSAYDSSAMVIYMRASDGSVSYTGDGTKGLYLWGAQLEEGSVATDYVPTTSATARLATLDPRVRFTRASGANVSPGTYFDSTGTMKTAKANLLTYSEDFEQWTWSDNIEAFGSGSVANSTTAPDGTTTADLIKETTSSGNHRLNKDLTGTLLGPKTLSVYAKAGTRSAISLRLYEAGASNVNTVANLSTGQIISGAGTIASIGNGWFRITQSTTFVSDASGKSLSIEIVDGTGATSYTGTGGTIYLWGAQLEEGSTASSYVPTTTAINYLPRFDYDPATKSPKGLLIEEQRTNLLTQSQNQSDSVWATGTGTITKASTSTVAPDGTTSATKISRPTGVQSSLYQDISVANDSVSRTASIFVRSAGSADIYLTLWYFGGTNLGKSIRFNPATGSIITSSGTDGVQAIGNGWYRIWTTNANNTSGNAVARLEVYLNDDGALEVWGAQLEQGVFPTSYIPTTTTAMTRSADIAKMPTISDWFNNSAGSFLTGFIIPSLYPTVIQRHVFTVSDGTNANQMRGAWMDGGSSGANLGYLVRIGSTNQNVVSSPALSANVNHKVAFAYANNDFIGVNNGTLLTAETGSVPSGLSEMTIGTRNGGIEPLNGHIRFLQYYNERLPNAALQSASAP